MDEFESLSHTKWDCKYHVVFIPKRRRKTLYAELRRHLAEVASRVLRRDQRGEGGALRFQRAYDLGARRPPWRSPAICVALARCFGRFATACSSS